MFPSNPLTGHLYFDILTNTVYRYDGQHWTVNGKKLLPIKISHEGDTLFVTGDDRYRFVERMQGWAHFQNIKSLSATNHNSVEIYFDNESDALLCYLKFK